MIFDLIKSLIWQSATIMRLNVSIMQFALCFALSSKYKAKFYKENLFIFYFCAKFWFFTFESCVQENNKIEEL